VQTTRFKIGCDDEILECMLVYMWVRNRVLPLVPGSGSCNTIANALSHLYDAIMPQLIRRVNHSLEKLIQGEARAQFPSTSEIGSNSCMARDCEKLSVNLSPLS
jgi:hypothetical protein